VRAPALVAVAALVLALAAACGGSSHPSTTPTATATTAADIETPPPATPTATTSAPVPAPCPDADVSLCEFATHLEDAYRARDTAAVVAASRTQNALCGHVQETNQQDICFGQFPGVGIPAYFVGRLHSDFGARLAPEGYVAFVTGLIQSTTMGSPEPRDDFGPGALRMYGLGPAEPRICTGTCRELVFSGIAGPANKGDALQRETLLLTVRKQDGAWAVEVTLSGYLTVDELKAKLRGEGAGYQRWNPREGVANPGTGGNIFAGSLPIVPTQGCVRLSPTAGAPPTGNCLAPGSMLEVTSGYVVEAGERWWHVHTIPSEDDGALPSSILDPS
jgi:hypothetical protein